MEASARMSRRELLRNILFYGATGTTFATLGGIVLNVWLAAGKLSPSHWTEIAPIEVFNRDGAIPFPDKGIAIVRRNQWLAALSLECTHLGCLVNTVDQGFFCPCHGSHFGPLGEVYSGPAQEPLRWHALQMRQGRVWIHSGKERLTPQWISVTDDTA